VACLDVLGGFNAAPEGARRVTGQRRDAAALR